MGTILMMVGVLLCAYGTFRLVLGRHRVDALILWGGLVDAGLLLYGLGTGLPAGTVGATLELIYTLPARILAWIALWAICPPQMVPEVDSLRGMIRRSPVTAGIMCFSLLASLDVSPFMTPEAKHFVLFTVAHHNLLGGVLTAIPHTIMLWLTAETIMAVCFADNSENSPGSVTVSRPIWVNACIGALVILLVLEGACRNALTANVIAFCGTDLASLPRIAFHNLAAPTKILLVGAILLLLRACRWLPGTVTTWSWASVVLAAFSLGTLIVTNEPPIERLFSLLASGVGVLVFLYSVGYIENDERKPGYYSLLFLTFAGINGVMLSSVICNLTVFWEIMSWSSFALIAWDRTHKARRAAILYMVICGAGAYLFTPVLFTFGGMNLTLLPGTGHIEILPPVLVQLGLFLAFLGFAAKAGLVPLHAWLPAAHPEAPSALSAPLSGVLTKTGIFGIVMLLWSMTGGDTLAELGGGISGLTGMGSVLVVFGLITMFYGEIGALRQTDIKRMFAYSTIGQVGEIVAVLGVGTWLAMTGALTHVMNHAIMKDLLFLAAGVLILRAGSRKLADLAGLARFMPWTATCMVIGLVAIMGLPPFNGFVGKYVMIVACIEAGHILLAAALLIASLIGAVYYMRVVRVLVFEAPSEALRKRMEALESAEIGWTMRLPLIILAGLCVLLGIVPQLGLSLVTPVVDVFVQTGSIAAGSLPGVSVQWPLYVLLPMVGAILPILLRRNPAWAAIASATVLVITTLLVVFAANELNTLSFCMALLVPFMGAVNLFYARGYMAHSHAQWRFYVFFLFMTGGLLGVAASDNLFSFFTFWEIMSSWALYFAIAHEGTPEALREALKYFLFNIAGAACLFLGVGILAGIGGAVTFTAVKEQLVQLAASPWSTAAMALLAVGFVLKAAQVSLRIDWQMHPNLAPTPVSGYISSVLLKVAVFGLVKLFFEFGGLSLAVPGIADPFHQRTIMEIVAWAGAFTLLYAALKAMVQTKVKMVFIWSTVSQIGYMVLGVALGTSLGVAGGLLHAANHMLFKDLLFLVAGAVMCASHRENLEDLGGLGRAMPVTMGCFALGALAAAGIPPTNGFTSKWLIYQALMQEGEVILALISMLGSVVTLAYLVRFLHVVFLGQASPHLTECHEVARDMRIPMLVLAALTVLTGVCPGLFLWVVNEILVEYGFTALDVSLFGIDSGHGAWNAGLISLLFIVAAGCVLYGLRRVLYGRPIRVLPPHACGLDADEAFSRMQVEGVYQAFIRLMRLDGQCSSCIACRIIQRAAAVVWEQGSKGLRWCSGIREALVRPFRLEPLCPSEKTTYQED